MNSRVSKNANKNLSSKLLSESRYPTKKHPRPHVQPLITNEALTGFNRLVENNNIITYAKMGRTCGKNRR